MMIIVHHPCPTCGTQMRDVYNRYESGTTIGLTWGLRCPQCHPEPKPVDIFAQTKAAARRELLEELIQRARTDPDGAFVFEYKDKRSTVGWLKKQLEREHATTETQSSAETIVESNP